MRQLLTVLVTIVAAIAVAAVVLWSLGSLGAWRQLPSDAALDSFYKYLVIAGVTGFVYCFARIAVTVSAKKPSAFDRSRWWREWAYVRWVLMSLVATWIFSALPPVNAHTAAEEALKRSNDFLKIYAASLIVGLLGTYAGVKEAALKRELKQ